MPFQLVRLPTGNGGLDIAEDVQPSAQRADEVGMRPERLRGRAGVTGHLYGLPIRNRRFDVAEDEQFAL